MGVQHIKKSVQCLGVSVKDINTVHWTQLCMAATAALVSMT